MTGQMTERHTLSGHARLMRDPVYAAAYRAGDENATRDVATEIEAAERAAADEGLRFAAIDADAIVWAITDDAVTARAGVTEQSDYLADGIELSWPSDDYPDYATARSLRDLSVVAITDELAWHVLTDGPDVAGEESDHVVRHADPDIEADCRRRALRGE